MWDQAHTVLFDTQPLLLWHSASAANASTPELDCHIQPCWHMPLMGQCINSHTASAQGPGTHLACDSTSWVTVALSPMAITHPNLKHTSCGINHSGAMGLLCPWSGHPVACKHTQNHWSQDNSDSCWTTTVASLGEALGWSLSCNTKLAPPEGEAGLPWEGGPTLLQTIHHPAWSAWAGSSLHCGNLGAGSGWLAT